jgi:hypothetical protein
MKKIHLFGKFLAILPAIFCKSRVCYIFIKKLFFMKITDFSC